MAKVSVIIPIHNKINVEKCLNGVTNQTLKDIEIICINFSQDKNITNIINKISKHTNQKIKIIQTQNSNILELINTTLIDIESEYISVIVPNIVISNSYFDELYKTQKIHHTDICIAQSTNLINKHNEKTLKQLAPLIKDLQNKIDICLLNKNNHFVNFLYRTEFLKQHNILFTQTNIDNDQAFKIKACYYANSISVAKNAKYSYIGKISNLTKYTIETTKETLNFIKSNNMPIRDKDFWAIKKSFMVAKTSLWKLEESLHTERFILLGTELYSCENKDSQRKQNILGTFITSEKNIYKENIEKILKIYGKTLIKKISQNNTTKYYLLNKPITTVNTHKNIYKKIKQLYKNEFDDIYILNANSGEMFLFLAYFAKKFISKNKSQKPLFIATQKYHIDILKLYCPSIPYLYIKGLHLSTSEDSWSYENKRFFLMFSKNHFEQVEIDINKNDIDSVHYFNKIQQTLKLTEQDNPEPIISEKVKISLNKKIKSTNLNINNFILLAPEAKSCIELQQSFWIKLVKELKNKGIDIFLNITNPQNKIKNCKTANLTFEEIFYLAQKAKAIISLRSGLSEFLLPSKTMNIALYTPFRHLKSYSLDTQKVISGFSMLKLPNVDSDKIYEINTEEFANENILIQKILTTLSNAQIKERYI